MTLEVFDPSYQPREQPEPTNLPPGSRRKIEILRQRVADGQQLWSEEDRCDCEGGIDIEDMPRPSHRADKVPGITVIKLPRSSGKKRHLD